MTDCEFGVFSVEGEYYLGQNEIKKIAYEVRNRHFANNSQRKINANKKQFLLTKRDLIYINWEPFNPYDWKYIFNLKIHENLK